MSVVLPLIDAETAYRDEIDEGDVVQIADGLTLVPAPGWALAGGALVGETRSTVGATVDTQLVEGGVELDVQAAPFEGTPSALLTRVNELNEDLEHVRGSAATTRSYEVTTRQGAVGLAEDFEGVHKQGTIAVFVFDAPRQATGSDGEPTSEGVKIVASGAIGSTARRRDEIVRMIRSLRVAR
jgi:hypothetical protein